MALLQRGEVETESSGSGASTSNQQRAQQLFRLEKVKKSWQDFVHRNEKSSGSGVDKNELWLCLLRIDRPAIQYLIEQWHIFRDERDQGVQSAKELRKLVLYECSFANTEAVKCFLQYLREIGSELREIGLSDAFLADEEDRVLDEASLVTLIRGLQGKTMSISHALLRGSSIGKSFEILLSSGSMLNNIRFWGCKMDMGMFRGLVTGIKQHERGLSFLALSDCGMDDHKLSLLVEALLRCPTKQALKVLDFSKSKRISESALPTLTKVIGGCKALENLNLNECRRLCWGLEPNYEPYLLFTKAISQAPNLRDLGLCSCGISDPLAVPLFAALEQQSHADNNDQRSKSVLRKLDVRGIDHVTKALINSLPQIKGLTHLCAHVNLESKNFRSALEQNTSLVEFNCMMERLEERQNPMPNDDEIWLLCSDQQVCRILQRNRLLHKVPHFLEHYSDTDDIQWPLCAEQLTTVNTTVRQNIPTPLSLSPPSELFGPWPQQSSDSTTIHDESALYAFVAATSLNVATIYTPKET